MRTSWSVIAVGLALALPADAAAADPLVSGYAGPGGSDQAVLGSQVLPGSGAGGGAGTKAGPLALPAAAGALSVSPRTPTVSPQTSGRLPADGKGAASVPALTPAPAAPGDRARRPTATPTVPTPTLARVSYPARDADGSGLSAALLLEVALVGLALVAVGVATSRLRDGGPSPA